MRILVLLIPLFLTQCATPPLNSERIEQRYGNYQVEILSQTDSLRISNLYSTNHDSAPTTRTLAFVRFADSAADPAIAPLHKQILAGASLGATFKEAGWQISKRNHRFGESKLTATSPDAMPIARLMRLKLPAHLAVHTYQLSLHNDNQSIPYATLTEFHHPDYLSLADLKQIYR